MTGAAVNRRASPRRCANGIKRNPREAKRTFPSFLFLFLVSQRGQSVERFSSAGKSTEMLSLTRVNNETFPSPLGPSTLRPKGLLCNFYCLLFIGRNGATTRGRRCGHALAAQTPQLDGKNVGLSAASDIPLSPISERNPSPLLDNAID